MSPQGYVMLGDAQIRTLDLVEKIRRFRGRYTRHQICEVLGHANDDKAYQLIKRLCGQYQIATKRAPSGAAPRGDDEPPPELLTAQLIAAKRSLAAEIAGHRNSLEIGLVPRRYKVGRLEW